MPRARAPSRIWRFLAKTPKLPPGVHASKTIIDSDAGKALGFHPDCWHPGDNRFPAMVRSVLSSALRAIHRTYLDSPTKSLPT